MVGGGGVGGGGGGGGGSGGDGGGGGGSVCVWGGGGGCSHGYGNLPFDQTILCSLSTKIKAQTSALYNY